MNSRKPFLFFALLLLLLTGAALFYSYATPGVIKNTGQDRKNDRNVIINNKQQNQNSNKDNFLLIPVGKSGSLSDISSEISQIKDKGTSFLNGVKNNFSEENNAKDQKVFGSAMSDTEIFDKLWPQKYRLSLRLIEDRMIKEGFVQEDTRNPMANDGNMFVFFRTMLDYAKSKGWVREDRYQTLRRGIDEVLPSVVGKERANLKQTGRTGEILPKDQKLSQRKPFSQTTQDILDGLRYIFSFAEPANAAWFRDVDCYKDDLPALPIPGPNLWAFCCNCGELCTPAGCTFIEDCGPEGAFCDFPLGCLNLACRVWPQAIWDPLTGVCGCG